MDKIISLNPSILGPDVANREQIEDLITLLVSYPDDEPATLEETSSDVTPMSSATIKFGPTSDQSHSSTHEEGLEGKAESSSADTSAIPEDLNKASDAVLELVKSKMNVEFEQHRLRPGDEGFEWDKEVNFEPPKEISEWDEED